MVYWVFFQAYIPLVQTQFHEPHEAYDHAAPDEYEEDKQLLIEREKSVGGLKQHSDFRRVYSYSGDDTSENIAKDESMGAINKTIFRQPTKNELIEDVDKLVDVVRW